MTDASALLREAAQRLKASGIETGLQDARRLLNHAAGRDLRYDEVPPDVFDAFEALITQRCARVPVSHLIGRRAFWVHEFIVTGDVLDPRPETEVLVEAALERPFETVLDLGTGSGAILVSLLAAVSESTGVGTDLSEAALKVAQNNAQKMHVAQRAQFIESNWFAQVSGQFDLIVSNPPYIAADEMPDLAPELGYEPRVALTDEADGLTAYRIIAAEASNHLTAGGRVLCEIGPTQAEVVTGFFAEAGFDRITVLQDLDGRDRVVSCFAR